MVSFEPIRVSIYASFILIIFGQVWCQNDCGKAFGTDLEGYVFGGEDALQGAWPWMVALTELNKNTGDQSPICTGFLIDNRHVISAAHCFLRNRTSLYSTIIGHVNMTMGEVYPISHIAVHEGYQKGRFYDDIALLTLSKEVNVPNFNPVCLPPRRALRNLTSRGTTFVGWGATGRVDEMSITLKQLGAIPVVSNQVCNEVWGRFMHLFPQGITDDLICAGFEDEPGQDICWGDSGGPLMIQEQNRWYAVGLAAFGYSCGRHDYPGVYTRLSAYLNWIKETKNLETKRTFKPQSKCTRFNEQCANSTEGRIACKDIRDCELAASILANGGWPKICDWVNNEISENNPPIKWPKVCCGIPQNIRETLITAFVKEEARKGDCGKILPDAKKQGLWPWVVRLFINSRLEQMLPCIGAMIDRKHFIAEARCLEYLERFNVTDVKVTIGAVETNQTYDIIDIKDKKEWFRASSQPFGILLITLSRNVEDPDFTPICLPDSLSKRNLTGMAVTSTEFSFISRFGLRSSIYQVISNYKCNEARENITERHICTKHPNDCHNFNQLTYEHRGRWNLIALTPYWIPLCLSSTATTMSYIRISAYLDWIKENVN